MDIKALYNSPFFAVYPLRLAFAEMKYLIPFGSKGWIGVSTVWSRFTLNFLSLPPSTMICFDCECSVSILSEDARRRLSLALISGTYNSTLLYFSYIDFLIPNIASHNLISSSSIGVACEYLSPIDTLL